LIKVADRIRYIACLLGPEVEAMTDGQRLIDTSCVRRERTTHID
jgi:hypothetical protein